MKHLIVSGLSLLLVISTTAPTLKANAAGVNPQNINNAVTRSQEKPTISSWLSRMNQNQVSLHAEAPASTAVSAQPVAVNPTTLSSSSSWNITPFQLVSLAIQGYFKDQGIPSYGSLTVAYGTGKVSAESLVKSAVASNKLSPSILKDQKYLNAVNAQLSFRENTGR